MSAVDFEFGPGEFEDSSKNKVNSSHSTGGISPLEIDTKDDALKQNGDLMRKKEALLKDS